MIRAAASTSIFLSFFVDDKHVFVATKHVLLTRQKYACRDKHVFVATNICRDEHTFVATKDEFAATNTRGVSELVCYHWQGRHRFSVTVSGKTVN